MLIKARVQSGWIKGIELTLTYPYLNPRYALLSPKPSGSVPTPRGGLLKGPTQGESRIPRHPPKYRVPGICDSPRRGHRHLLFPPRPRPGHPGYSRTAVSVARRLAPPAAVPAADPAPAPATVRGDALLIASLNLLRLCCLCRPCPAPPDGADSSRAGAGWARLARRLHPCWAPGDWLAGPICPPPSQ